MVGRNNFFFTLLYNQKNISSSQYAFGLYCRGHNDITFASGKGICILYLEYPSQASSCHFSCCFSKLVIFNSVVKSSGSLKNQGLNLRNFYLAELGIGQKQTIVSKHNREIEPNKSAFQIEKYLNLGNTLLRITLFQHILKM